MSDDIYFSKMDQLNLVKTKIVHNYFKGWAKIMLAHHQRNGGYIGYRDLFAGPGRFNDGSPSTPLWILETAIADDELSNRLVTHFNDVNADFAARLSFEIGQLANVGRLRNQPQVSNYPVTNDVARALKEQRQIPTLFFLDPWGYKGLNLDLIGAAIGDWGCECILFFNYNRINPGITNSAVDSLIEGLFGSQRIETLRQRLVGLTPDQRQDAILEAFIAALGDVGGSHVLPFVFESEETDRPSHYVIFVSKHFRGYHLMKEVMSALSSDDSEIKRLEYVPIRSAQMKLFPRRGKINDLQSLKEYLVEQCQGQTQKVEAFYANNTVNTPYTKKNVKDALIELEAEGLVSAIPPAANRPRRKGGATMGDNVLVTFPRKGR